MAFKQSMSEKDLQQAVRRLFHNHQYILTNSFVFDWESDLFSVTKSGNVYEVEMKISRSDFKKDFGKEKHLLFQANALGKSHHIIGSPGRYVWDKERIAGTYLDPGFGWQHPKGYYYDYKKGCYITGYGNGLFSPKEVELRAPCTKIKITPVENILCPNRFYYACPPGIINAEDVPKYAGLIHIKDQYDCTIIKQAPFIHKRQLLGGPITNILLDKFWYLSQNQRIQLNQQ